MKKQIIFPSFSAQPGKEKTPSQHDVHTSSNRIYNSWTSTVHGKNSESKTIYRKINYYFLIRLKWRSIHIACNADDNNSYCTIRPDEIRIEKIVYNCREKTVNCSKPLWRMGNSFPFSSWFQRQTDGFGHGELSFSRNKDTIYTFL